MAPPLFEATQGCSRCIKVTDDQKPMLRCSGCHTQIYCSTDCQKEDWKTHKPRCKTIQAGRAEAARKGRLDPVEFGQWTDIYGANFQEALVHALELTEAKDRVKLKTHMLHLTFSFHQEKKKLENRFSFEDARVMSLDEAEHRFKGVNMKEEAALIFSEWRAPQFQHSGIIMVQCENQSSSLVVDLEDRVLSSKTHNPHWALHLKESLDKKEQFVDLPRGTLVRTPEGKIHVVGGEKGVGGRRL